MRYLTPFYVIVESVYIHTYIHAIHTVAFINTHTTALARDLQTNYKGLYAPARSSKAVWTKSSEYDFYMCLSLSLRTSQLATTRACPAQWHGRMYHVTSRVSCDVVCIMLCRTYHVSCHIASIMSCRKYHVTSQVSCHVARIISTSHVSCVSMCAAAITRSSSHPATSHPAIISSD
jgi:hypothetical protein